MKKWMLILLAVCLVLVCGYAMYGTGEEPEQPGGYLLYFLEQDLESVPGGGALRAESIWLPEAETADTEILATLLMQELLAGPQDETLKSTIPSGTILLSLHVEGSQALVDLSTPYGTLSGVSLTLADQAITLTLTQLPDILSVRITVRGRELAYREKQVFAARDVLLAPEGDVVSTVDVMLYFLDGNGYLKPEQRTLDLYEGDTQVSAVARAMENGPLDKQLSSVLPEGFRVKSVWLEEDVCYVNLSSGMLDTVSGDRGLATALRALAKALCSLESVGEVRYLVDGEFADYYGSVNVARPYMS